MKPQLVVIMCFNCFCLGAILCEMLMLRGVHMISFYLGVPAFIAQIVILLALEQKPTKGPHEP